MRAYSAGSGTCFPVGCQPVSDRRTLEWKPSITLATGERLDAARFVEHCLILVTVLSVILEKVNNPSADDPFEPEIAAVSELI